MAVGPHIEVDGGFTVPFKNEVMNDSPLPTSCYIMKQSRPEVRAQRSIGLVPADDCLTVLGTSTRTLG